MKWEEIAIGEVCKVGRGSSPRPISDKVYFEGGQIPWIKIADATNSGKVIFETKEHVNRYGASFSRLLPEGSLILATSGVSLGQVKFLGMEGCIHDGWLYLDDFKNFDRGFMYYVLIGLTSYFHSQSYGAAIQNINTDILRETKIPNPSLPTQQKIASILSAYDDLIENNLKRIRLLEEAAQHLYREWFVKFRFPGWEEVRMVDGLPEGWERKTVGEAIEYHIGGGWGQEEFQGDFMLPAFVIRGTDIPKLQQGNSLEVPFRFHTKSNLSSRKLQEGDLVFEVSGGSKGQSIGRSLLITSKILDHFGANDVMCASFCKLVRVQKDVFSPYYFEAFIKESYTDGTLAQYENQSASNIINFRFNDFLSRVEIVAPAKSILEEFENVIAPIKNQAAVVGFQNQKLKEARDILLPRLMNQTIEV